MKLRRDSVLFCCGGSMYVGLELLWRQRSHWSMFLAGGLCFQLLGKLEKRPMSLVARAGSGAAVITLVELGTGLLVNRSHRVWDYRDQPGNLWGQVCPLFTLLWMPLSLAGMYLHRQLESHLPDKFEFGGESPLTIRAWQAGNYRYTIGPTRFVTVR